MPVASLEWGKMACDSLGIAPDKVKAISIVARAGDPLTADIELLPNTVQLEEVTKQIAQHIGRIRIHSGGETVELEIEEENA